MINPKELRIGNLIKYNSDEGLKPELINTWVEVTADVIKWASNPSENCYEPIPLTPEILERCGFYKERDVYDKNKFVLHHNKDFGDFRYNRTDGNSTSLFFLHRLQNLYFELKGEELKITPYKAK